MKPQRTLLHGVVLLVTFLAGALDAANLTPDQFRKFRGTYTGRVSGIAGNASGSSAIPEFSTKIVVTGKTNELLTPLMSNLFTAPQHRIVWRKPTGTTRRATLVGVYVGTFSNGVGAQISVKGTRRLVLLDRGSAAIPRYIATLSDDLKEVFTLTGGTSAAQELRGTLRK